MTLAEKISEILDTGFAEAPVESDHAALANYYPVNFSVGELSSQQITGIIASRIAMVNQFSDDATADKGIGIYGINLQILLQQGYIKNAVGENLAGTGLGDDTPDGLGIAEYLSGMDQARVFQSIYNKSSWTNRSGIDSVEALLSNTELQSRIYQQLILDQFRSLERQNLTAGLNEQGLGAVLAVSSGLGPQALDQLLDPGATVDSVVAAYVRNSLQGFNIAASPEMSSILDNPERIVVRRYLSSSDLISAEESDFVGVITGGAASYDTTPRSYEASEYLDAVKTTGSSFAEDVGQLIATGLALYGTAQALIGTAQQLGQTVQNVAAGLEGAADAIKNGAVDLGKSLGDAAGAFGISNIKKAIAGFLPTQGTLDRAALEAQVKAIFVDPSDPNSAKLQIPNFSIPSLADIKNLARQLLGSIPNPVTEGIEAFNTFQGTVYSSLDQATSAYNNAISLAQTDLLAGLGSAGGRQASQAINDVITGQGDQTYSLQDLTKLRLGINTVTSSTAAAGVNLITAAESNALSYYNRV